MYAKCNRVELAMEMFSDLRQFEEAKAWAEEYAKGKGDSTSVQELIHRQAEWSEEVNDYEAAADMYLKAKKYDRAIQIIGKNEWADKLLEVMRSLGKMETKALSLCASFFRKWGNHQYAKETYIKLGDIKSLIGLHVESHKWDDAFVLLKTNSEYTDEVYLPYAKYLALNDKFDEARLAYKNAGRPDQSTFMLEQLTHNAVMENRFNDAAYYFWLLARECLDEVTNPPHALTEQDRRMLERFRDLYERAQVYYAYYFIYHCMDEPFHSVFPSTLLNIGRFLLCKFSERPEMPLGVSLAYVLHTLAKHGEALGAYKTARFAYNKLQSLKMPSGWHEQIDLACVITRSKPFSDKEDLLPVCYRCGTVNPLVNSHGDVCINCGAAFIRSFITFEHLPLVEFELERGISDTEATQLLEMPPPRNNMLRAPQKHSRQQDGFTERVTDEMQTLTFDDEPQEEMLMNMDDPFHQQMAVPHSSIVVDRNVLRMLDRSEVLVRKWPCPALPNQYFRIMDPDLPLVIDEGGQFYEADEFELSMLEHGHSPFTRQSSKDKANIGIVQ